MAEIANPDQHTLAESGAAQNYAPSWIDRFTDWVERLPIPAWLSYLLAGTFLLVLFSVIKWRDGVYAPGQLSLFFVAQSYIIPYMVAVLHYLDHRAAAALDNFRPALSGGEQQYAALRHRLTTLPAVPALLVTVLGIAYGMLPFNLWTPDQTRLLHLQSSALSGGVEQSLAVLSWAVVGVFAYHCVHQLRVVNTIFTTHTRIDFFKLAPIYAFSSVAAITAVALIGGYFLYIAPALTVTDFTLTTTINAAFFSLLGAIAFFGSLMGAHGPLVQEKARLLDENAELMKTTMAEVQRRARSGQLEGMDQLKATYDSLSAEQTRLEKISTWPWRNETLRAVGPALLLPLLLSLADQVVRRLLGI